MNVFRKFISVLLVAPIVLLATFCCCIEKAAFAAPDIKYCHSDSDSSQAGSDDKNSSQKSHECSCPQMLGESNDAAGFKLASLPSGSHHFQPIVTMFVQKFVLPTEKFLSFHSPPRIRLASLPLYLKYSVLRI